MNCLRGLLLERDQALEGPSLDASALQAQVVSLVGAAPAVALAPASPAPSGAWAVRESEPNAVRVELMPPVPSSSGTVNPMLPTRATGEV